MLISPSLGSLRETANTLRARRSTGPVSNEKFRTAAMAALAEMITDLPQHFISSVVHLNTIPDVSSSASDVGALIEPTDDLWVMRLTTSAGAALSTSTLSWRPTTDGTWEGVMWIEVKRANGAWARVQTREWWFDDGEYYVSLWSPWPWPGDAGAGFTIYQDRLWLPGRLVEARAPLRLYRPGAAFEVVHRANEEAARRSGAGDLHQGSGLPSAFWKSGSFALDPPTRAPVITQLSAGGGYTWPGPVQEGKWKFYFTYAMGYRDVYWNNSVRGVRDPVWESLPSPASAVFDQASSHGSIAIRCVNIDYEVNFDLPAAKRYGHSGFRIRVYAQRVAISEGATPAAVDEASQTHRPLLLAEIQPYLANVRGVDAEYIWNGSVIPDPSRPMPRIAQYDGIQLNLRPDQRYEFDMEAALLAHELVDDADAVPLHADAMPALFHLTMAWYALADGLDWDTERLHRLRYEEQKRKFRALREGDVDYIDLMRYDAQGATLGAMSHGVIAPFTEQ